MQDELQTRRELLAQIINRKIALFGHACRNKSCNLDMHSRNYSGERIRGALACCTLIRSRTPVPVVRPEAQKQLHCLLFSNNDHLRYLRMLDIRVLVLLLKPYIHLASVVVWHCSSIDSPLLATLVQPNGVALYSVNRFCLTERRSLMQLLLKTQTILQLGHHVPSVSKTFSPSDSVEV